MSTAEATDVFHRLLTSFGGVPCGQIWADFLLWELVLNDRSDLGAIVEIGTWQGGFSRYLHCQAEMRGMEFVTYDVLEPNRPPPKFEQVDVFARAQEMCDGFASYETPIALLCDGGNKPREAQTFAPMLKPTSFVFVHDWMEEFDATDIPDCLEPVYEDVCDSLRSMTRVYERKF